MIGRLRWFGHVLFQPSKWQSGFCVPMLVWGTLKVNFSENLCSGPIFSDDQLIMNYNTVLSLRHCWRIGSYCHYFSIWLWSSTIYMQLCIIGDWYNCLFGKDIMDQRYQLPFEAGQSAEARSFEVGYRGAWFRCKVQNTLDV